jgi:hypothetical protein
MLSFANVNNSSGGASRLWRQVKYDYIELFNNTDHNIDEVRINPLRGWVLQTVNHKWHI